MKAREELRRLLKQSGIIVAVGAHDALTARVAETLGFELIGVGGYAVGASLSVTEPLLSLTEFVAQTRYITSAVNVPVIADADAGFGDAIHTIRTVKEFEAAGCAAIHIEDQIFPKRMGYHLGETYVVAQDEMVQKVKAALDARTDDDFVICARTDAIKAVGGGFEEGLKRVKAYENAGAEMIMAYPETKEQLTKICSSVEVPIIFDASVVTQMPIYGGGGAPPTPEELEKIGVKVTYYSEVASLTYLDAIWNCYKGVKEGQTVFDRARMSEIRSRLEQLTGIQRYYAMEKGRKK